MRSTRTFSSSISATVEPSLAGPTRPQDRVTFVRREEESFDDIAESDAREARSAEARGRRRWGGLAERGGRRQTAVGAEESAHKSLPLADGTASAGDGGDRRFGAPTICSMARW